MFLRALFIFFISIPLFGCGVKGKPLPPEKPREIGIGKPQYKGVDKELKTNENKKKNDKEKK